MVVDSGSFAKKALTIAIRYAAIRRQFGKPGAVETKILDYVIHQHRLMPLLAQAVMILPLIDLVCDAFYWSGDESYL